MTESERRQRIRIGRLANRTGCRIQRPKPDDPVDKGAYRLIDVQRNAVLLGPEFDASLDAIEAYLKQERPAKKTPLEMEENIVRQLATKRNFVLYKSRPRLYVTKGGDYQLFRISDRSTPLFPDDSPTLDELKAFLRTQPVDPTKGFYKPCPTRAERMHHA